MEMQKKILLEIAVICRIMIKKIVKSFSRQTSTPLPYQR